MSGASPPPWTPPRFRIDRDGTWFHEDQEITHAGILANLWSNLRVDAEGHFLQVGPMRIPVEVSDAPFAVVRVEPEAHGLAVTLSDQSRESLRPETLWIGPEEVPYCRVKAGRFTARLSRAAAHQLFRFVEPEESSGQPVLVLGDASYPLPRRDDSGRL